MRIGFVIDRLDPARGGAEAYLIGLGRFLSRRGHEIHHLSQQFGPGVDVGVTHPVRLPRLPRFLRDLAFDRVAARAAGELDLDVSLGVRHTPSTQVFQPHGGVYSRAARAQSRSAGNAFNALARAVTPKHRALMRLEALQQRRAARLHFVALSRRVQADMAAAYRLGDSNEPVLIYNGVDAERFRPGAASDRAEVRRAHGVDDNEFLVLFMGHNFRLKGLRHLLAALTSVAAAHLLVVGRGRESAFRAQAEQLGLASRVTFVGVTDEPERYFGAADVLAHPTYYDPCSSVCLEALASGLPVITTRANGVGELMEGDRGGFVLDDATDEAALASALNTLARDESARSRKAEEARQIAEAHPEEEAFAAMEQVLVAASERR